MSSSDQPTDKPVAETKPTSKEVVDKKPAKEDIKPEKTSSKSRSGLLFIIIILLIATTAGSVYSWLQTDKELKIVQQSQARQDKVLNNAVAKYDDVLKALDQLSDTLEINKKTRDDQQQQISNLIATQQTLQQTTKNVFDISHRGQSQWVLSEVSYLLSLANQRLIVSRDIRTAVAALKAANNRLHDLADPSLLNLRKKITHETSQLNLLKLPDINGVALSLDNMTAALEQLPFKSAQQKHIEGNQSTEKVEIASLENGGLLTPIWDRVKSLVTIKKHHRNIQETQTPLQKSDIDSQLRYRLQTSRLALINKNTTVFQHEINSALKLLTVYYDKKDNRVAGLHDELSGFSKLHLLPALPDITGSWLILQNLIAVQNAGDLQNNKKGKSIK